jgi:hypothetical protein
MIAIVPISVLSGDIPCDGDPALEDRVTLLLSSFVSAAQRLKAIAKVLEVTPVGLAGRKAENLCEAHICQHWPPAPSEGIAKTCRDNDLDSIG